MEKSELKLSETKLKLDSMNIDKDFLSLEEISLLEGIEMGKNEKKKLKNYQKKVEENMKREKKVIKGNKQKKENRYMIEDEKLLRDDEYAEKMETDPLAVGEETEIMHNERSESFERYEEINFDDIIDKEIGHAEQNIKSQNFWFQYIKHFNIQLETEQDKTNKVNNSKDMSRKVVNRSLVCHTCLKEFTAKWILRKHQESVHSNRRYLCQYCHSCTRYKRNLKSHIRNTHRDKPMPEASELSTFMSEADQLSHQCDVCRKASSKNNFKGYRYKCNYNLEAFVQNRKPLTAIQEKLGSIVESMIEKLTTNLWQCKYCANEYTNYGLAMEHCREHIKGLAIPHTVCKKSFRTNASLKVHMAQKYHYSNDNPGSKNATHKESNKKVKKVKLDMMKSDVSLPPDTHEQIDMLCCNILFENEKKFKMHTNVEGIDHDNLRCCNTFYKTPKKFNKHKANVHTHRRRKRGPG